MGQLLGSARIKGDWPAGQTASFGADTEGSHAASSNVEATDNPSHSSKAHHVATDTGAADWQAF